MNTTQHILLGSVLYINKVLVWNKKKPFKTRVSLHALSYTFEKLIKRVLLCWRYLYSLEALHYFMISVHLWSFHFSVLVIFGHWYNLCLGTLYFKILLYIELCSWVKLKFSSMLHGLFTSCHSSVCFTRKKHTSPYTICIHCRQQHIFTNDSCLFILLSELIQNSQIYCKNSSKFRSENNGNTSMHIFLLWINQFTHRHCT